MAEQMTEIQLQMQEKMNSGTAWTRNSSFDKNGYFVVKDLWEVAELYHPVPELRGQLNYYDKNPDNLPIVIENKFRVGEGYSGNYYDIRSGMVEGVLYPSLDPSIFEVKYPNVDIKGKVIGDNLTVGE